MRTLPVVVASLLLSSLASSGCARRPDLCEDGSRTAPLCRRIDALHDELAERTEAASSLREQHAEQDMQIASLTERLALVEEALEVSAPTGVPECDRYIRRYSRCIDETMPEAARETSHKALWTSVRAWQRAALTPAGREGLGQACLVATEAVQSVCGWD